MPEYFRLIINGVNVVYALALLVLAVIFLTNLANLNLGELVLPSFGLLLFATAPRFVVIKTIEFFGRNQL